MSPGWDGLRTPPTAASPRGEKRAQATFGHVVAGRAPLGGHSCSPEHTRPLQGLMGCSRKGKEGWIPSRNAAWMFRGRKVEQWSRAVLQESAQAVTGGALGLRTCAAFGLCFSLLKAKIEMAPKDPWRQKGPGWQSAGLESAWGGVLLFICCGHENPCCSQ